MKGQNLPINTMVLLLVAVIVLLGAIMLFGGIWGDSSSQISLMAAKENGCSIWISSGCDEYYISSIKVKYDADGDGKITDADTLDVLLEKKFGITDYEDQKKACNCPGS